MSIIIERMERDPLDLYHVTGADALIAARNMYEAAAKELERGGRAVRHPLSGCYHPATEDEAARLVVWYGSRRLVVRCATDAVLGRDDRPGRSDRIHQSRTAPCQQLTTAPSCRTCS